MDIVLELVNIEKTFGKNPGRKILKDISLSVHAGECVGIAGQSGCGKTTLAKIIAGSLKPDSGSINLCGRAFTGMDKFPVKNISRYMQIIFQQVYDSFNPRKTLGWSVGEGLQSNNYPPDEVKRTVKEMFNKVGLPEEFIYRYPHEVSGGQCQRAAIARAVILRPALVICDEITSALDVTTQETILSLLSALCKEHNIACLFISHDLAVVQRISKRVLVMHEGEIIETGVTKDVITRPKSVWTKKLLEADWLLQKNVFGGGSTYA